MWCRQVHHDYLLRYLLNGNFLFVCTFLEEEVRIWSHELALGIVHWIEPYQPPLSPFPWHCGAPRNPVERQKLIWRNSKQIRMLCNTNTQIETFLPLLLLASCHDSLSRVFRPRLTAESGMVLEYQWYSSRLPWRECQVVPQMHLVTRGKQRRWGQIRFTDGLAKRPKELSGSQQWVR